MASGRQSKEYQLAVKIAGSVSSSFNSAMGEAGQKMTDLGLLFIGDQEMVKSAEGRAEPILLIGEDGSSALVWNCYWIGDRRDLKTD